tara:strand:- start:709 stop:810 length:102 start_codon:yes stop_codon:yes gene_type:complete
MQSWNMKKANKQEMELKIGFAADLLAQTIAALW